MSHFNCDFGVCSTFRRTYMFNNILVDDSRGPGIIFFREVKPPTGRKAMLGVMVPNCVCLTRMDDATWWCQWRWWWWWWRWWCRKCWQLVLEPGAMSTQFSVGLLKCVDPIWPHGSIHMEMHTQIQMKATCFRFHVFVLTAPSLLNDLFRCAFIAQVTSCAPGIAHLRTLSVRKSPLSFWTCRTCGFSTHRGCFMIWICFDRIKTSFFATPEWLNGRSFLTIGNVS